MINVTYKFSTRKFKKEIQNTRFYKIYDMSVMRHLLCSFTELVLT